MGSLASLSWTLIRCLGAVRTCFLTGASLGVPVSILMESARTNLSSITIVRLARHSYKKNNPGLPWTGRELLMEFPHLFSEGGQGEGQGEGGQGQGRRPEGAAAPSSGFPAGKREGSSSVAAIELSIAATSGQEGGLGHLDKPGILPEGFFAR